MAGESSRSNKGKSPAVAAPVNSAASSPVDPNPNNGSSAQGSQSQGNGSTGPGDWYPGKQIHGFDVPDPNYDLEAKRKSIMKNREEGKLFSITAGFEDDPQTAAEKEIARWEKQTGKTASAALRKDMTDRIVRNREGGWLAGAKIKAQGQDKVPIDWFNRLVSEREDSLNLFATKAMECSQIISQKQETIENLKNENQELKEQASKGKSEDGSDEKLTQCQAENNALKEDLAKAKSEVEENDKLLKADLSKAKSDLETIRAENEALKLELAEARSNAKKPDKSHQEKIERLESENRESYRQRNNHMNRAYELDKELGLARKREQDLKEDNRRLTKALADCEDNLRKSNASKNAPSHSSNGSNEAQAGSSDAGSGEPGANPDGQPPELGGMDTLKVIRELKKAKEENRDVREEADDLINRWLARVADNHNVREFYNTVDELSRTMGALQAQIITLYNDLRLPNGDAITAGEALDALTRYASQHPEDEDFQMRVWALKLIGDTHVAERETKTERVRNDTLNKQLDMCKTTDILERESTANYGMAQNEEVLRQVEERTQTYRMQRRAFVGTLFAANAQLTDVAAKCPHQPTIRAMEHVCNTYLDPITLPLPALEPSRHY
ncbi:hypothetical protein F5Y04DRAFT_288600 [Hypomontagnella monticulosa]|nr:hypothetical protein F5Y04DRAFT_288600 [Hypomontagnella monticulosa]